MAPPRPSNKEKGKGPATSEQTRVADPILEEIPAPCATLDLNDTDNLEKNYTAFIEKLIQTMKDGTDVQFSFTTEAEKAKQSTSEANEKVKQSIPVTPGLDHTPRGNFSFDILLRDTRLRLVCDKYQFWFRGLVTADGRRYEIDEPIHPKVMKGSSSLHTNGMYPRLLGGASVNICKVGYQPFLRSVEELAKLGRSGEDLGTSYKTAIAVLLVMCFEAARFKEVFDFCLSLLKAGEAKEVGEKNRLLINDWSDICGAFYEENGDTKEVVISPTTPAEVSRVYEGVRILCRSKWDRWIETNVEVPKPKKQSKK